jgi:hypothetical protein
MDSPKTCMDSFTITVTCVSGPCAQQVYVHSYEVTWNEYAFTGTGHGTEGGLRYDERICGAVAGKNQLSFRAIYTTHVPGYTITGTATVGADGTATGTGHGNDPRGAMQEFTLVVSKMKVACKP